MEATTEPEETEEDATPEKHPYGFCLWPSGEAKDWALRLHCLDRCFDENGVMLVDYWHMAADFEKYIRTGEASKRPQLAAVKK